MRSAKNWGMTLPWMFSSDLCNFFCRRALVVGHRGLYNRINPGELHVARGKSNSLLDVVGGAP